MGSDIVVYFARKKKGSTLSLNIKKLALSKGDYYTFQITNNKCADQTARRSRLICAFVVCMQQKSQVSLHLGSINIAFYW